MARSLWDPWQSLSRGYDFYEDAPAAIENARGYDFSNNEKLQKGLGIALVRGAQDTELTVEMDEDVRAWLADNAAQESFGELLPPLQMPVVDLSVNRLFAAAPVASILQKIRDAGLHATKHMCSWLYPSPWLMSVLRLLDRSYSSKA